MMAKEHGAIIREAGVREDTAALDAHRVIRKVAERNMIEDSMVVWILFTRELGWGSCKMRMLVSS